MSHDLAKAFEDLAAEALRCAAMLRGLRVAVPASDEMPDSVPRCRRCGMPEAHYFHGPGPAEHLFILPTHGDVRRAQAAKAPPQAPSDCGCTLYARCDFHERHKPKGCTCNGPFYSASCPTAAHAAHGRAWPPGDPAAVG